MSFQTLLARTLENLEEATLAHRGSSRTSGSSGTRFQRGTPLTVLGDYLQDNTTELEAQDLLELLRHFYHQLLQVRKQLIGPYNEVSQIVYSVPEGGHLRDVEHPTNLQAARYHPLYQVYYNIWLAMINVDSTLRKVVGYGRGIKKLSHEKIDCLSPLQMIVGDIARTAEYLASHLRLMRPQHQATIAAVTNLLSSYNGFVDVLKRLLSYYK